MLEPGDSIGRFVEHRDSRIYRTTRSRPKMVINGFRFVISTNHRGRINWNSMVTRRVKLRSVTHQLRSVEAVTKGIADERRENERNSQWVEILNLKLCLDVSMECCSREMGIR